MKQEAWSGTSGADLSSCRRSDCYLLRRRSGLRASRRRRAVLRPCCCSAIDEALVEATPSNVFGFDIVEPEVKLVAVRTSWMSSSSAQCSARPVEKVGFDAPNNDAFVGQCVARSANRSIIHRQIEQSAPAIASTTIVSNSGAAGTVQFRRPHSP